MPDTPDADGPSAKSEASRSSSVVVPIRDRWAIVKPFPGPGRRVGIDRVVGLHDLHSAPEIGPPAPLALHPAPVSPVDPAALVGELIEIGIRVAAVMTLLPLRLTAASVRAAWSVLAGPSTPPVRHLR